MGHRRRSLLVATAVLAVISGSLGATGVAHAADPLPVTITAVGPASGPTSGGNQVFILGTNFTGNISRIYFGGSESTSWNSQGGTLITAAAPAHAAGVVDVTLQTVSGPVVLANAYTYGGPDAPTGVGASATAGGADVLWTAPASDGGSALTSYIVYVRVTGTSTWTTYDVGSTATTYSVTGLTSETPYTIAVRAVNVNGPGSWSSTMSVTPLAAASPPGAPTSLGATAGDGQVSLSWTAPSSDGGSPITRYEYSAFDGTSWSSYSSTGSTGTAYAVTGLANGTAYTFRVRAVTANGAGTAAESTSVTPTAPAGGGGDSGGSGGGSDGGTSTSPQAPASSGSPSSTPATTPTTDPAPTTESAPTPATVDPIDHAIVAVDDTVRYTKLGGDTQWYLAPGVLANDSDTANHPLTARRGPLEGSNGGQLFLRKTGAFTYTPDPSATRTVRERFVITVVDSLGELAESQLTVVPNRAPSVPRAEYSAREGVTLRVSAADGLLAGASDPDGDATSVRVASVRTTATQPKGSMTIQPNGALQYSPFPATTTGTETFAFEVTDSFGRRTESRVTINIGPNRAPDVPATQYSLREGTTLRVGAANGLLSSASDPDGDDILVKTYSAVSTVPNRLGGLILSSTNGAFTYQAFPGRTGLDGWSFDVVDALGKRTVGRVTFTIVANQAPVVPASQFTTSRQSTLTVSAAQGLLAGASDPEGDAVAVVIPSGVQLIQQNDVGTFMVNADGSFTFHPNPMSTAVSDSLVFEVTDSFGKTTRSSVTVALTS